MKSLLPLLCMLLCASAYGQDKYNYNTFNKLTPLAGSDYVIASVESVGKMMASHGDALLFINTRTGEQNRVDLPADASIHRWEHVKMDSLGINLILLTGRTVNLDNNKKGIDWNDPIQIIAVSTDGKQKTQLTEDKFFAAQWTIHPRTGAIVITGYYDSNNNGKYDKTDKDEILVIDLKTLKRVKV
ncbi:hypothetical protein [Chitinophaga caseinilytica]|uniref:hypothetical protein n=1 Tax=Chitinophaga caseinilytica TaxID=2267521 RepID=UPI003C2AB3BF